MTQHNIGESHRIGSYTITLGYDGWHVQTDTGINPLNWSSQLPIDVIPTLDEAKCYVHILTTVGEGNPTAFNVMNTQLLDSERLQ